MKLLLPSAILLATAGLLGAAAGSATVTYVSHEKVAAALANSLTMVRSPELTVLGSHRAAAGQVEVHEKETDVFYVTEGGATLVTGGTMLGGKPAGPGQQRGSDIRGGETHNLTKGDVIVIPAGTPHWFKTVPRSITYYVVKVLKP